MPITITDRARKALGVRASAYITEHYITTSGGGIIVPERYETPRGICRTLTSRYGRPSTIDRGEVAYWTIDTDDWTIDTDDDDALTSSAWV